MTSQRIKPAYYLMEELYRDVPKIELQNWDRDYLLRAHDRDYIDTVERLSDLGRGVAMEYGLGTGDCPVWEGMADISEFVVGSTLSAIKGTLEGNFDAGFVLLGGLHHATRSMASGFCYYNDINVGIHYLKDKLQNPKILYIDTDLHHGDGVQFDFYQDPNVVTYSQHEDGRWLFPGTGFTDEIGEKAGRGSKINMPLYPYTWDKEYLTYFDRIVKVLFETVTPDYVIWQAGSDARIDDPLGHLQLTSSSYYHMGQRINALAQETMDNPRLIGLGGGGYSPVGNAKSWSHSFAGLAGVDAPNSYPDSWVKKLDEIGLKAETLKEPQSLPPKDDKNIIEQGNTESFLNLVDAMAGHFPLS